MLSRRRLLQVISTMTGGALLPSLALARGTGEARFVLVVLRGAVDGLAVAAPYGDGNYRRQRGELALEAPGGAAGLLPLDGFFGLHPALGNVAASFAAGDATVVHAVASPYRSRSHFDGQDLLESGATAVGRLRDGWLNRALAGVSPQAGGAIALARNAPLVLRGPHAAGSWAPSALPETDDDTLSRLAALYAEDPFFRDRLAQALETRGIAGDLGSDSTRRNEAAQFPETMAAAARFLTTPDGPRIAVVELSGWDTHANQGAASGALANRLRALDDGLARLRDGLDEVWAETAVAVVTEFGRTVRVNGTRGTDHGTATAALLVGGAIKGGHVVADWPGLGTRDLYDGRDLRPTTDLRRVFKGLLIDHLDMAPGFVEDVVFPDSRAAPALENLVAT